MHNPETFTAPLGSAGDGQLQIQDGAYRTLLRADRSGDDPRLFAAEFSGGAPLVSVDGGRVSITHGKFGWWPWSKARHASEVALTSAIPWRLRLGGGACSLKAHLRELDTREFEIRGGACDVELELGRAHGLVPVRIHGGACRVRITRPSGVAVRFHVEGGARELDLDTFHASSVGGSVHWETPGFAGDGYDVRILGGVSGLFLGVGTNVRAAESELAVSA